MVRILLTFAAKFMRAISVILLCGVLAACGVASEVPLSPKSVLPKDSPLVGAWVLEDRRETTYLHIGNDKEATRIVTVFIRDDGRIKTETYEAAPARINGTDYLSVEIQSGGHGKPLYYIFKYAITEGGELSFWAIDFGFMKAVIEDGLIAGNVDSKLFTSVTIQADQRILQEFVKEYGPQMFSAQPVKLRRVK